MTGKDVPRSSPQPPREQATPRGGEVRPFGAHVQMHITAMLGKDNDCPLRNDAFVRLLWCERVR